MLTPFSLFQTKQRAVKRYRRAADGRAETAADVRSLEWLERTMTHLWEVTRGVLAEALGHEEEKGEGIKVERDVSRFVELYDFVSDRFMAVRKDMILQGLHGPGARGIYQRIIRFHIFFDYLLTQQVSAREKEGEMGSISIFIFKAFAELRLTRFQSLFFSLRNRSLLFSMNIWDWAPCDRGLRRSLGSTRRQPPVKHNKKHRHTQTPTFSSTNF